VVTKKFTANILLVVFILQLFGMSAMYFSQRYAFKQSAFKIIESNNEQNFTFLQLTNLEFQLAKFEEHELFINGQLYDIISTDFYDEIVIVKVFRDTQEEAFLQKTINWFDSSDASKSSLPKLILKTFFNPAILIKNFTFRFFDLLEIQLDKELLLNVLNICRIPVTPPPNVYFISR